MPLYLFEKNQKYFISLNISINYSKNITLFILLLIYLNTNEKPNKFVSVLIFENITWELNWIKYNQYQA